MMSASRDDLSLAEQASAEAWKYALGWIKAGFVRLVFPCVGVWFIRALFWPGCLVLLMICCWVDSPILSNFLVFALLWNFNWTDQHEFLYEYEMQAYRYDWGAFVTMILFSLWLSRHYFGKLAKVYGGNERKRAVECHIEFMPIFLVVLYIIRPNIIARVTSPECYPLGERYQGGERLYMIDATIVEEKHWGQNMFSHFTWSKEQRTFLNITREMMEHSSKLKWFVAQTHLFYHLYIFWIWSFFLPMLWAVRNVRTAWTDIRRMCLYWGSIFAFFFCKTSLQYNGRLNWAMLDVSFVWYYASVTLMLILCTWSALLARTPSKRVEFAMPSGTFRSMLLWLLFFVLCDAWATCGHLEKVERLTAMFTNKPWSKGLRNVPVKICASLGALRPLYMKNTSTDPILFSDISTDPTQWWMLTYTQTMMTGICVINFLSGCYFYYHFEAYPGKVTEAIAACDIAISQMKAKEKKHTNDRGMDCLGRQTEGCVVCDSYFLALKNIQKEVDDCDYNHKYKWWLASCLSWFLSKKTLDDVTAARISWSNSHTRYTGIISSMRSAPVAPPVPEPL